MKNNKRILALLILITLITVMFPTAALAAADCQITSISLSPEAVSPAGGTVSITITIKNIGTLDITELDYTYSLPSGPVQKTHFDNIAVGASKTYTDNVNFQSGDLDTSIQATLWCNAGGWVGDTKNFTVKKEDNIIRSGSEIIPEQNIYYVGDTVTVTDTMRNSININVTDLKMKYYFRRAGDDTSGETITFATLAPNEKVANTLNYTFTEDDLGGLRIGSSLSYIVAGGGPYTEYNVAHDFTVKQPASPTGEVKETQTPTPKVEAIPPFTPEPTATAQTTPEPTQEIQATNTPTAEKTEKKTSSNNNDLINTILGNRVLLLAVMIIAGIIVVLIFIFIIVLITKRK